MKPRARSQSNGVEPELTPADTGVIGWGPERASMNVLERYVGKREPGRRVRLILFCPPGFVKGKDGQLPAQMARRSRSMSRSSGCPEVFRLRSVS